MFICSTAIRIIALSLYCRALRSELSSGVRIDRRRSRRLYSPSVMRRQSNIAWRRTGRPKNIHYLTPKRFAEKSRLTVQYLIVSFDLYRKAGEWFVRAFELRTALGCRRVQPAGVSELAEIASLRAHDFPISIVGPTTPTAPYGAS